MSIDINAKKLGDYLVKVTANTDIGDGKFLFTENGMVSILKDLSGVILIHGKLNKTAFSEYESGVELNIQDTRKFIQALKLFKENVNIVVEQNMAKIIDENGSFDFVLPEKVESSFDGDIPLFSLTKPIIINKSLTDSVISTCKIIDTAAIVITNENKKTSFNIGKESNKANKTIVSDIDEKSKIDISKDSFCSIFSVLDPVFDLRLPKGEGVIPILINERTEDYDIIYIVSPIIDLDENTPAPEAIIKKETTPSIIQAPVAPVAQPAASVTQAPEAKAPEAQAPVTQAPVTQAPITQAPITQAP